MSKEGFFGRQGLTSDTSENNAIDFKIRQSLLQVRTSVPVKVIAVHGGGVDTPPTLDVQPLVKQTDGQGNSTEHGIIYGIPVARSQGGSAAIVNDPKVGDVGHMSISDRDISALKSNKGKMSNPGSFRTHDMADGIYTGTILSQGAPTRYINLNGPGIEMGDEFGNTLSSSGAGWNINGVVIGTDGSVTAPQDIVAGTVSLQTHVHTDVTTGSDLSGPPQA